MDKQQIQKEIDSISADRDALERTRNKLTGDIALLLQQIAEVKKKPKRRHGDFGIDFDESKTGELHFPVLAIKKGLDDSLDIIFRDGSPHDGKNITWLGNIFDLMKNDEFLEMIATLKRKQS